MSLTSGGLLSLESGYELRGKDGGGWTLRASALSCWNFISKDLVHIGKLGDDASEGGAAMSSDRIQCAQHHLETSLYPNLRDTTLFPSEPPLLNVRAFKAENSICVERQQGHERALCWFGAGSALLLQEVRVPCGAHCQACRLLCTCGAGKWTP